MKQLKGEIKMKIKIILTALLLTAIAIGQNTYEVTPGTKGNEIKLTVANISETNPAGNVTVAVTKKSSLLNFSKETETIELIEAKAETEASFKFDINRNAPVNKKDTIDFMITDINGTSLLKSFIFNYTAPKEFRLEQNYPNPFNPTTTIQYQLAADSKVTLKVYDILGSEVATLINEDQEAGYKEVKFNASNLASGMYIYRITAGSYVSTKKLMLLK